MRRLCSVDCSYVPGNLVWRLCHVHHGHVRVNLTRHWSVFEMEEGPQGELFWGVKAWGWHVCVNLTRHWIVFEME